MKQDEIKKRLLAEKERLKEELKAQHRPIYDWLLAHNIDLDHLAKYTQNIAAALILTTNQLAAADITPPPAPTPPPDPSHEQVADEADTTSDEKTQKKAEHIWALYGNTIIAISEKYNIDPQLIFATIMTESGGNTHSYRFEPHINDASYGMGQILYGTALGLGFRGRAEEMYQPIISIDLVARYHQRTRERYGELTPEQMTTVYNTGSLLKTPRAQHIERFQKWYAAYPGPKELATSVDTSIQ